MLFMLRNEMKKNYEAGGCIQMVGGGGGVEVDRDRQTEKSRERQRKR